MTRATIVIPAYEPTPALIDLVDRLAAPGGRPILVVNDGSSPSAQPIFDRVARMPGVEVLVHAVNLGKGQALKTAFNHFLLHAPADAAGVVTADADGQHLAQDVSRVAEELERAPSTLVLGSRGFEGTVPARSRFGNTMTRVVFRGLIGRPIQDTQTGLRGIPRSLLGELMQLEAGRYEFELDMLVRAASRGLPIEELPIQTVYGGAGQSHFNPLRDSLRIYFVFLRFAGLSMITAAVDFLVFWVAYAAMHNILAATALGRLVAGLFNFTVNRTLVFKSRGAVALEAIKYASLVAVLMAVSYGLVTSLVIFVGLTVYVAKVVAEGTLFAASFALQNLVVFPDRSRTRNAGGRTDWDAYYRKPAAFAPLTRKTTRRLIVRDVTDFGSRFDRIVELGGGNSSMLAAMRERFPSAQLTAVDTNALGLDLLRERLQGDAKLTVVHGDVLAPPEGTPDADLVFSVGLVEHFDVTGTARAIAAHFDRVAPGGIVLITFPTPTWLYRLVRAAAERLGVWAFPDERPLSIEEVRREVAKRGEILRVHINWAVILTQGIIVARAR